MSAIDVMIAGSCSSSAGIACTMPIAKLVRIWMPCSKMSGIFSVKNVMSDSMMTGNCSSSSGTVSTMPCTRFIMMAAPCSKMSGRLSVSATMMPSMIVGSCSMSCGSAAIMPSTSPLRSCIPASTSIGMLSMSEVATDTMAFTNSGMSVGSIWPTEVIRPFTNWMAASAITGTFSTRVCAIISTASTATGASSGSSPMMELSPSSKMPAAASTRGGNSSPIAGMACPNASGKAAARFSTIGVTFFTTLLKLLVTSFTSLPMSAFSLPRPANKFCMAALVLPHEPLMVSAASFAVVPVMPISVWMTWIASVISEKEVMSNVFPASFPASSSRRCISSCVPL